MPDSGQFDGDVPAGLPTSWGQAFAALPMDAPGAGGWNRLQARLPARPQAARWPAWLALAAALALVVVLPLRQRPGSRDTAVPVVAVDSARAHADASAHLVPPVGEATTPGLAEGSRQHQRVAPAQRPLRTVAGTVRGNRLASRDPGQRASVDALPMDALYAESAHLEQLLALTRDEHVASGVGAALASQLDARIASIDAALVQPGLSGGDLAALWQQRVDALQQLVGLEATSRLYASHGQSYDAALATID